MHVGQSGQSIKYSLLVAAAVAWKDTAQAPGDRRVPPVVVPPPFRSQVEIKGAVALDAVGKQQGVELLDREHEQRVGVGGEGGNARIEGLSGGKIPAMRV